MSSNKAPLFKGVNYAFWSIRMRSYLMALGCDVWLSVIKGYDVLETPPSDTTAKKLFNDNSGVSSKSALNCQHNQRTGRRIGRQNSCPKGTTVTPNEN
jgi:hypothetical protein